MSICCVLFVSSGVICCPEKTPLQWSGKKKKKKRPPELRARSSTDDDIASNRCMFSSTIINTISSIVILVRILTITINSNHSISHNIINVCPEAPAPAARCSR